MIKKQQLDSKRFSVRTLCSNCCVIVKQIFHLPRQQQEQAFKLFFILSYSFLDNSGEIYKDNYQIKIEDIMNL